MTYFMTLQNADGFIRTRNEIRSLPETRGTMNTCEDAIERRDELIQELAMRIGVIVDLMGSNETRDSALAV